MTAITLTESSVEPIVSGLTNGASKRRSHVYLRFTSAAAQETLDLTTVDATIADVEGIVYETDDGAKGDVSTASTWSTSTFTCAKAGVEEVCLVVTHT